ERQGPFRILARDPFGGVLVARPVAAKAAAARRPRRPTKAEAAAEPEARAAAAKAAEARRPRRPTKAEAAAEAEHRAEMLRTGKEAIAAQGGMELHAAVQPERGPPLQSAPPQSRYH